MLHSYRNVVRRVPALREYLELTVNIDDLKLIPKVAEDGAEHPPDIGSYEADVVFVTIVVDLHCFSQAIVSKNDNLHMSQISWSVKVVKMTVLVGKVRIYLSTFKTQLNSMVQT